MNGQSHLQYRDIGAPRSGPRPPAGLPTHYQSASQGRIAIKDMTDHHLNAAIIKLSKVGASPTPAALHAEKVRRI